MKKRNYNVRLVSKGNSGVIVHIWSEKISDRWLRIENITFHYEPDGEVVPSALGFLAFHLRENVADVHLELPNHKRKCLFVKFSLVDKDLGTTDRVQLPLDGSNPSYNDDIPVPEKKRRVPPCQP